MNITIGQCLQEIDSLNNQETAFNISFYPFAEDKMGETRTITAVKRSKTSVTNGDSTRKTPNLKQTGLLILFDTSKNKPKTIHINSIFSFNGSTVIH